MPLSQGRLTRAVAKRATTRPSPPSSLTRTDVGNPPAQEVAGWSRRRLVWLVRPRLRSGIRADSISKKAGARDRANAREFLVTLAVFAVYAALALIAYWPILPGDSNRMATCSCGDSSFQTWLLGWIPFALAHGHNPFFSSWTNYPVGVNLVQNTDMPLLGLLAAPITITLGPIVSFNLLLWLSFPISAISMYWVTRQWTGSHWGALAAGLLYGFSSYMVGQGLWHVMLVFVPLPPLFFLQLHKLVVRRDGRHYLNGALLGLIASAQFFVSAEIMASMFLLGAVAVALYALAEFGSIARKHVSYVLRGLLPAA